MFCVAIGIYEILPIIVATWTEVVAYLRWLEITGDRP